MTKDWREVADAFEKLWLNLLTIAMLIGGAIALSEHDQLNLTACGFMYIGALIQRQSKG